MFIIFIFQDSERKKDAVIEYLKIEREEGYSKETNGRRKLVNMYRIASYATKFVI